MTVKASVLNDSLKISKVVCFINFKVNHITNKTSIITQKSKTMDFNRSHSEIFYEVKL